MDKSAIATMPVYFDRYINQVGDVDYMAALSAYGSDFLLQEKANMLALGDRVYEVGKWTVKDIVQHLIDCERIFGYRALRIARTDKTPLPGFDEELFAATAQANDRTLESLLAEFVAVRQTTLMLFESFTPAALMQEGISNGNPVSVIAIAYIIAGHTQHHVSVLQRRYYPIL